MEGEMGIRINGIVIDANDLDLLAEFWSRLLGLAITRREEDWISLGPHFAMQRVPEAKRVKNRVHFDLVADDFPQAVALAVELGASPVGEMQEDLWQVWRDPEGNEFCICVS
jgi:predicted enzyme related to lactoylglutathione lyase